MTEQINEEVTLQLSRRLLQRIYKKFKQLGTDESLNDLVVYLLHEWIDGMTTKDTLTSLMGSLYDMKKTRIPVRRKSK